MTEKINWDEVTLAPMDGEPVNPAETSEEASEQMENIASEESGEPVVDAGKFEQDTLQAVVDANEAIVPTSEVEAEIERISAELKGEILASAEAVAETPPTIEDIYGMDSEKLGKVIKEQGNQLGEFKSSDPNYKEKYNQMLANHREYKQSRVKLFDRVLGESATDEEVELAVAHARKIGTDYSLAGFSGGVPKSWYANERIATALAESSDANKKFVERVRRDYTTDELRKGGYEKINEDGSVGTYAEVDK